MLSQKAPEPIVHLHPKRLQALFGFKFNPFAPDIPVGDLYRSSAIQSYCFRIDYLAREGGFAMICGEHGTGKSAVLRILQQHLASQPELAVAVLTRPQSMVADFYRELGELFGVRLSPHNRWAGSKILRERWHAHIQSVLFRPVLLVDEAQEMLPAVLAELRLLQSKDLDSFHLLTVVLCGDHRLAEKLRQQELAPLDSRIRCRLTLQRATAQELGACLTHLLQKAGNPSLMTKALQDTLCEHSTGNLRLLMNLANELLTAAAERQLDQLDEKLFLEFLSAQQTQPKPQRSPGRSR